MPLRTKIYVVEYSKFAAKQMRRLPGEIQDNIDVWQKSVERLGLPETMKLKGYHDEPLKGQREGQRSVRLNRAYRLIYEKTDRDDIVILGVKEVNKHDY